MTDTTFSPAASALAERLLAQAQEILARYPAGRERSALLPLLHLVQSEEGYVSPAGVAFCAEVLGINKAQVGAVATFYTMYKRRPTGDFLVSVCTNTMCNVLGGQEVYDTLTEHLGVGHDETTPDGGITLEHAECLAACDYGPVMTVNYDFYDNVTPDAAVTVVDQLRRGERPAPTRGARVCTLKEMAVQLAGFADPRTEALGDGPAGAPTLRGVTLAQEHGIAVANFDLETPIPTKERPGEGKPLVAPQPAAQPEVVAQPPPAAQPEVVAQPQPAAQPEVAATPSAPGAAKRAGSRPVGGKATRGKATEGEATEGKAAGGKPTRAKTTRAKASATEASATEASAGEASAGEASAGKAATVAKKAAGAVKAAAAAVVEKAAGEKPARRTTSRRTAQGGDVKDPAVRAAETRNRDAGTAVPDAPGTEVRSDAPAPTTPDARAAEAAGAAANKPASDAKPADDNPTPQEQHLRAAAGDKRGSTAAKEAEK